MYCTTNDGQQVGTKVGPRTLGPRLGLGSTNVGPRLGLGRFWLGIAHDGLGNDVSLVWRRNVVVITLG